MVSGYLPVGPAGLLIGSISSNYVDSSVIGALKGVTDGVKKTSTIGAVSIITASYAGIFYLSRNVANYNPWTIVISYTIGYGLDYLVKKHNPSPTGKEAERTQHKYQTSRKEGQKIAYQKSWKKLFSSLLKLPLLLIPHKELRTFIKLISDILTEAKLISIKKENSLVLVDDEKIIWCVGLKISREAMPNAQSDAIVGVWLEKH